VCVYAPSTYSTPSNKCASKERKGKRKKKEERHKDASIILLYTPSSSYFLVSFEIYTRLILRVFTVQDEAQEIKKRMVCHISATDRSLAASIYELRVAQGEKSATTQKNKK
jgi:hypothetical protein